MSAPFRECAQIVQRLHRAVGALERAHRLLDVPPLEGREWFEVLRLKLLPQLLDDAFLVVAVVGGTNIGKSVIFNHLAGSRASATSPLASGTKHPVCLVPPGFAERHDLASIFEGFRLREWATSDAPLEEQAEHQLFWQTNPQTPENLLVLDTPDIDSDAPVNWQRADNIRRCADILIAVLTQQKYNDAAVKQFFRKAAAEDKAVLVVFNQCQLPDDEEYWPLWLETFCRETHLEPEFVYVAPNDRQAAEENRLPFYQRPWPPPERPSPETRPAGEGRNLAEDLSRLHFAEIKLRTLRGSLTHLLDRAEGVPEYLREVEDRSARFRLAAEHLSAEKLARLDHWPPVPNSVMIDEIRKWWQTQREGWSARVHGFYNTLGEGLSRPFRFVRARLRGEQMAPLEQYRKQEWRAILETVEKAYERLTFMSESGNELLSARLDRLLGGTSRTELLAQLEAEHGKVDLQGELQQLVAEQLRSFRDESQQFYTFLKRLDQTAAVARPATSVVLFMTGFGPAGEAAAHVAANTAIQSIVHVVGDVTGGTVAAAVGDTAVSGATGRGAGYLEAKFRKLHATFTGKRLAWLLQMLNEHLWGTFLEELSQGAAAPKSPEFGRVQDILRELERQLNDLSL